MPNPGYHRHDCPDCDATGYLPSGPYAYRFTGHVWPSGDPDCERCDGTGQAPDPCWVCGEPAEATCDLCTEPICAEHANAGGEASYPTCTFVRPGSMRILCEDRAVDLEKVELVDIAKTVLGVDR